MIHEDYTKEGNDKQELFSKYFYPNTYKFVPHRETITYAYNKQYEGDEKWKGQTCNISWWKKQAGHQGFLYT